jgi:DNA repair photolyase
MIFAALARVRVAHVLVDALNLRGAQWGRVLATLKRQYPELVDLYHGLRRDQRGYASALAQRVARASQRHNLPFQLVA